MCATHTKHLSATSECKQKGEQRAGPPISQDEAVVRVCLWLATEAGFVQSRSLAFLVLFRSIAAFGTYLTLLGRIGAHKAGYALVMFPVVALVISFFAEGLEPSWNILIGVSLVLLGNVFVLRDKAGPSDAPVPSRLQVHPICAIVGVSVNR